MTTTTTTFGNVTVTATPNGLHSRQVTMRRKITRNNPLLVVSANKAFHAMNIPAAAYVQDDHVYVRVSAIDHCPPHQSYSLMFWDNLTFDVPYTE